MRSRLWILAVLLAVMPLAGCGDDGNEACEPCTNVDDCEVGLTCQQFVNPSTGQIQNLCGDDNPDMRCPGN